MGKKNEGSGQPYSYDPTDRPLDSTIPFKE